MANLPIFVLLLCSFCALAWANEMPTKLLSAPISAMAPSRAQLRMKAEARVERINKKGGRKWTAKLHPRFAEMPDNEMRRWLGLRRDHVEHKKVKQLRMMANLGQKPPTPKPVPDEHFDVRQKWPECADVVNLVQDQSGCGSCWAVASASVIQDRICMASGGAVKVNVSSEDILSCEAKSYGCEGGYPENAFTFWHAKGVCSGGAYGSKKGCKPYPFPPHPDHMYQTPRCKHRCENRYYRPNYRKDKHYGLEPVHLEDATEEQIMDAIIEGGPVEADMVVYYDFFHYNSGVYEHEEDSEVAGGHAVRIIGWGHDNETSTDYWLVANSWNTDWGMGGFFKIARGQDECQIESWGINYAEANLAAAQQQ